MRSALDLFPLDGVMMRPWASLETSSERWIEGGKGGTWRDGGSPRIDAGRELERGEEEEVEDDMGS